MSDVTFFAPLPEDWEPTRATLHAYAKGVGAIPRALGISHPKWWHISLTVRPTGLATDPMPLRGGGSFDLRMDLRNHAVVLESSRGHTAEFSMREGLTGTQFAEQLISAAADLGLDGSYDKTKFDSDDPREYDPVAAEGFFTTLVDVDQVFQQHRATLSGAVSPVQLWPHGFDLAFEWFGTRVETYEEDGEVTEYPSQLNLGFYPAGRAYFYSNPWPFDADELVGAPLPSGAEWHTEGWQGTILYYDQLAGADDAAEQLLDYARGVYEVTSPTLLA